jgi:hypothetical protein
MNPESPGLDEQLQAIREQLTRLHQELAVVAERQQLLFELLNRGQPLSPAASKPAQTPEQPSAIPAQEVLAECAQDLLRVFQEVGHPLTTLEILEEVVRRQLRWRESTVSHTLAYLTDHGLVSSSGNGAPHRYQLQPGTAGPSVPGS